MTEGPVHSSDQPSDQSSDDPAASQVGTGDVVVGGSTLREAVFRLPKVELHVHLDGSVRPQTLWELLEDGRRGKRTDALQSFARLTDPQTLAAWIRVDATVVNLGQYLARFALPLALMQTGTALERVARELVADAAAENVRHIEVRFAPNLHTRDGMPIAEVVQAVLSGLRKAADEHGVSVGLIACCMRHLSADENSAMVREITPFLGHGLVAVDLAGDEATFPLDQHISVLQRAKDMGFPLIIHAGEAGGVAEIRGAVERLGAKRIGHGVRLADDEGLLEAVAARGIALEMCPTSNVQTRAVPSLSAHPLKAYMDRGVAVTVNTDNRTMSHVTLSEELARVAEVLQLSLAEVGTLNVQAAKAAFLPATQQDVLVREITSAGAGPGHPGESPPGY